MIVKKCIIHVLYYFDIYYQFFIIVIFIASVTNVLKMFNDHPERVPKIPKLV